MVISERFSKFDSSLRQRGWKEWGQRKLYKFVYESKNNVPKIMLVYFYGVYMVNKTLPKTHLHYIFVLTHSYYDSITSQWRIELNWSASKGKGKDIGRRRYRSSVHPPEENKRGHSRSVERIERIGGWGKDKRYYFCMKHFIKIVIMSNF